jgi:hypothetical protein
MWEQVWACTKLLFVQPLTDVAKTGVEILEASARISRQAVEKEGAKQKDAADPQPFVSDPAYVYVALVCGPVPQISPEPRGLYWSGNRSGASSPPKPSR